MKLRSLRRSKTYIPKFNNNRELPTEEQIVVEYKNFPTISEAKSYKTYRYSTDGATEMVFNDAVLLIRHVGKITNLEDDDGKILDGLALSKSENLLLDELVSELREYALEVTEKLPEEEN